MNPVERALWELAHLHLPLQEAFLALGCPACRASPFHVQLVLAAICVKHLAEFPHHLVGLHGACNSHITHKVQRVWLGLCRVEHLHLVFAFRFIQVTSQQI